MDDQTASPQAAARASAVAALLANVDRLLNDCDTLIAGGGHASATSLATHAFEECGKAYALRYDLTPSDDSVDRQKYHHAVAMVALCFAILKKYDIDVQRFSSAILPYAWAVASGDAPANAAERLNTVLQATLEPILLAQTPERARELGSDVKALVDIGRQIQAGEVGAVRKRGLQVETDHNLAVVSDPAFVPREAAARWAWAADGILHLLRREDHRHPDRQELSVLIEALGQERADERLAA